MKFIRRYNDFMYRHGYRIGYWIGRSLMGTPKEW